MSFKIKAVIIVAVAGVCALFAVYFIYAFMHYRDRFLPNTSINGTDVSGLTKKRSGQKSRRLVR